MTLCVCSLRFEFETKEYVADILAENLVLKKKKK